MSQPTPPTALTPQFCFNERALRDFLRLSRSTIDDTISTQLNALLTPSTSNPFTHTTTSTPHPRPSTRPIPRPSCDAFKTQVLFPTWSARSGILTYCGAVASAPDSGDPNRALRERESLAERDRVVDERLDPYSGRFFSRWEARTERLREVLRLEEGVERIVRRRVWAVLGERCADEIGMGVGVGIGEESGRGKEGWEVALDKWREGVGRSG